MATTKRIMSHQAEKTIQPLKAIFNFEEPIKTSISYNDNTWKIEGTHKTRKHVSVVLENCGRSGLSTKYMATLVSNMAPNFKPVVKIKEKSLLDLVEGVNAVINFRI